MVTDAANASSLPLARPSADSVPATEASESHDASSHVEPRGVVEIEPRAREELFDTATNGDLALGCRHRQPMDVEGRTVEAEVAIESYDAHSAAHGRSMCMSSMVRNGAAPWSPAAKRRSVA